MSRWGDTEPAAASSSARAPRGEYPVRITWTRRDPDHGRIPVGRTRWYLTEGEARVAARDLERELAAGWVPELGATDIDIDGPPGQISKRTDALAQLRAIREQHRRTA